MDGVLPIFVPSCLSPFTATQASVVDVAPVDKQEIIQINQANQRSM
jgi:hypothetical protein